MSEFTDNLGPFLLTEGDPIIAVVEALNAVGYSTPSSENTGAALT